MLLCPVCKSQVTRKSWTQTTADHEGDPVERTGTALYCENRSCDCSVNPLEESECISVPNAA